MKNNTNRTNRLLKPGRNGGNGHDTPPIAAPAVSSDHGGNGNGKAAQPSVEATPGAFVASDNEYRVLSKEHPALTPERELILGAAWNRSGEQVVRAHHVAKFDAEWAGDEQVLRQVAHDISENVQSGESHERNLSSVLHSTDPYVYEQRETKPWTIWDRVQLAAMLLFSIVLLAVDINSTALILMNSGLDGFRGHYWKAALFNLALIIGGAFLIKAISAWLTSDQARRRYTLVVASSAIVSLIVALPVFARMYARMTIDPIALMTGEVGSAGSVNSALTFALQIFTGNLIAGTMWLTASLFIERHRPSIRIENPAWRRVKDDLDVISNLMRQEGEKLGLVQAGLVRIDAERRELVTRAVELYKLAEQSIHGGQK